MSDLLQDIRRLDETWISHNDTQHAKAPQSQYHKVSVMITLTTNMLGVDIKEQQIVQSPTTFTTFTKDEKGPYTYYKDHQPKKVSW